MTNKPGMRNSSPKDFRYLHSKNKFLEYAYLALKDHFHSECDFLKFFNDIETDELKNLFLKTVSFYLFLVKYGDWKVFNIPESDEVIDYLTNTYKYVSIFSLIESISTEKFIDFYNFLIKKSSKLFPIQNKHDLDIYYKKYKEGFGSIRRCISFFKTLPIDRQNYFISKLEAKNVKPSIENFAKSLYEMRSKFIHEAQLVLHMSKNTSIGHVGNKLIICNLSINDMKSFFEEGLLAYFKHKSNSND